MDKETIRDKSVKSIPFGRYKYMKEVNTIHVNMDSEDSINMIYNKRMALHYFIDHSNINSLSIAKRQKGIFNINRYMRETCRPITFLHS